MKKGGNQRNPGGFFLREMVVVYEGFDEQEQWITAQWIKAQWITAQWITAQWITAQWITMGRWMGGLEM